jgi:phosphotransferase system, enzyme I, PtsP
MPPLLMTAPDMKTSWPEFTEISSLQSGCPAMTEMVRTIANALDVDVCSIYRFDRGSSELVLAATMGLNQSSVGQIRMSIDEGLVGLVAREQRPVLVEDAPAHPEFRYFESAGEDPFVCFFGVPIVDGGQLRGVLVIQTVEQRDLHELWASVATAAIEIAEFVSE